MDNMDYYAHSPIDDDLRTIAGTNIRTGRIRTGRRGGRHDSVYFCPKCGRDMIFMREVPAFVCVHCGHTQYMQSVQPQNKPPFVQTDASATYIAARPANTKPMIRNAGDPRTRSKFNSRRRQGGPDEEIIRWAQNNNASIVDYREYIPKTDERSVSSEELRAQKR